VAFVAFEKVNGQPLYIQGQIFALSSKLYIARFYTVKQNIYMGKKSREMLAATRTFFIAKISIQLENQFFSQNR
jgi:hypothetical protein